MAKFIVTLVTTDIVSVENTVDSRVWEGAASKVVEGNDAESVARARIAEEAAYCKEAHENAVKTDKTTKLWEDSFDSALEKKEQIVDMLTERHNFWNVLVFTLEGIRIGVAP